MVDQVIKGIKFCCATLKCKARITFTVLGVTLWREKSQVMPLCSKKSSLHLASSLNRSRKCLYHMQTALVLCTVSDSRTLAQHAAYTSHVYKLNMVQSYSLLTSPRCSSSALHSSE